VSYRETEHLRVLIANERKDRLALVAPIVASLGHEVIAREIEVDDVGPVTARERPDVALVGLGESSGHALALIEKIVQEAGTTQASVCGRSAIRSASPNALRTASSESWSTPATSCASAGADATTTPSPPRETSPTHSHARAASAIS
jgi:hypothetical protein